MKPYRHWMRRQRQWAEHIASDRMTPNWPSCPCALAGRDPYSPLFQRCLNVFNTILVIRQDCTSAGLVIHREMRPRPEGFDVHITAIGPRHRRQWATALPAIA
jgi:hypothetical protein